MNLDNILELDRVEFLFGNEYKNKMKELRRGKKICNKKNFEYNEEFYFEVIRELKIKKDIVYVLDHSNIVKDCIVELEERGYEIQVFDNIATLIEKIKVNMPKFIFSINYQPSVSKICCMINVPYIGWVVDTPCYSLYDESIICENNYIFIYDKDIVVDLKSKGIKNVWYMPIATNTSRLDDIQVIEEKKYLNDCSFLGALTISEYSKLIKDTANDETIDYLDFLMEAQNKNIEQFYFKKNIKEIDYTKLFSGFSTYFSIEKYLTVEEKYNFLLGREHSQREREYMVKLLECEEFKFRVYGNEEWETVSNVYESFLEHFEEMPKLFKATKVNINLARTFVEAGLPMRIFDVLGSGGFLLTNYKSGLEDCFDIGKDLVVFKDFDEMIELIKYYLNNPEERKKIAKSGYEKVKKYHNYNNRFDEILKIVFR